MGCDHYFYLLSASKYIKLLRPMYRSYYGPIGKDSLIWEQQKKIKDAKAMDDLLKGNWGQSLVMPSPKEKGPFEKYYPSVKPQCDDSSQLYAQISDFLSKNAEEIDDTRNHFLRMEQSLRQMDLFQNLGSRIKVSNILQVQNYLQYLQITKEGMNIYSGKWKREFSGIEQAHEIFSEVLSKLQKSEQQTYLIFKSVN